MVVNPFSGVSLWTATFLLRSMSAMLSDQGFQLLSMKIWMMCWMPIADRSFLYIIVYAKHSKQ